MMNGNDTVAVVEHAPQPDTGLFSIDPGLAVWTWVVFGLLFVVLRKYAWTPMMLSIRERERTLAEAVKNARLTKEQLATISKRQEAMLSEALLLAAARPDAGGGDDDETPATTNRLDVHGGEGEGGRGQ